MLTKGPSMQQTIATIAREILDIPTLKVRGSDSLDTYTLPGDLLQRALEAAYKAGQRSIGQ